MFKQPSDHYISEQIIATSHDQNPQKVAEEGTSPYFRNLFGGFPPLYLFLDFKSSCLTVYFSCILGVYDFFVPPKGFHTRKETNH